MLKHCVRESWPGPSGKPLYRLIGPDGPIPAFEAYCRDRGPHVSVATLKGYAEANSQFIDYLYELGVLSSGPRSKQHVNEVVEGYVSFMRHGAKSRVSWVRDAVNQLPHAVPYADATIQTKLAAINDFLEFSEDLAAEALYRMQQSLGQDIAFDYQPIVNALVRYKPKSSRERVTVRQNTMLGGVIRNAVLQLKKNGKLSIKVHKLQWDEDDADFPIDQFDALLGGMRTYRDKAIATLLFGGGLRNHEGFNMRIPDINFNTRTAYVHDPNRLRGLLTLEERGLMRFKGRSVSRVFFIPLLRDLFFDYLYKYMADERPHLRTPHDFVFCNLHRGSSYGAPYFMSDDSTRLEPFHRAQITAGLDKMNNRLYGFQALRHSYGIYMLNHLPLGNGRFGLSIEVVQRLMGHEDKKSTERYARHDVQKIDAILRVAESLYSRSGLSIGEMRDIQYGVHLNHIHRLLGT